MTTEGNRDITYFQEWNGAKLALAIALIIVDESYIIQKCHVLGGVSILSKFKEVPAYEGKHVGAVLDEHHMMKKTLKKRKKAPAVMQALSMAAEQALVSISKKNITNVN